MNFLLLLSIILRVAGAIWCLVLWKREKDLKLGLISFVVLALAIEPAILFFYALQDSILYFVTDFESAFEFVESIIIILGVSFFIRFTTERQKSQLARIEAEKQSHFIFENSLEGLTIRSAGGELVAANPAYCSMLGYTEAELKTMDASSFVHPDSLSQFDDYLQAARPGGSFHAYVRDVCKDGSIIDVEIFGSHFMYSGEPHVLGIMHKMSDQKRSERALKITERQLREQYDLLEHHYRVAPVGLCMIDKNYRYIRINELLARINGMSVDDHIGKTVRELVPEIADHVELKLRRVLELGQPSRDMELCGRTCADPDNDHYFLENYDPVIGENGEVEAVTCAVMDITERKFAEQKLRLSEQRSKYLFKRAPLMMHSVNKEFKLVDVNDTWLKKLGYTREEVIGTSPISILTEESQKLALEVGFPTLMAKGEIFDLPYQMITKSGEILDVELSARRENNQDNEFEFSIAMIADITERKRVESEREELKERLRQAQKMETIGTLAGGIAHDFNNILAGILLCAESAATEVPADGQAREELDDIVTSAHRAGDLVRQILTFSRKVEGKRTPVKLDEIIRESFTLLRASLSENIRIDLNLAPNAGTVLADSSQMTQVVMNLCSNALQAMNKPGGVLTIDLSKELLSEKSGFEHPELKPGNYVTLTVSDTGDGISKEAKARIFEPFYSTKGMGEGVGLGLSVVHGIVLSCEGKITVESEPHTGTTFKIYLPAFEGASGSENKSKHMPEHGFERILIVDDEEMFVRKAAKALNKLGYDVEYFTTAMSALEAFSLDPDSFDIVITDHRMADLSGIELSKELMTMRPNIPIVLITGLGEGDLQARCEMLGIRKFLIKPVSVAQLSEAVREALVSKPNVLVAAGK